ncbi:dynactin-associated protein-like [Pteropus medius]|uniref:dynactin-associated protein-like n=1 Tax=Pteropus vampyrus TaxID=132908 RepID=UPI00196AFEAC|nr:dynactin-associated protein-like [Pteropus giganteus]XP_039697146.1 dynactin-associated protein-like [Pteropus giganteus]
MDGKQQQSAMDVEQNTAELLPRNPYCSNEGTHCDCRLPHVTFQPQLVTAKPRSLWKTFLVCLLACLIATALIVLVLYFVHFGKPTTGTTIIIHADGKSSHVACIPGFTPSPASSSLPGSQGTLPSISVTNKSSPTTVPPSTMEMTKTTEEHEVIIED